MEMRERMRVERKLILRASIFKCLSNAAIFCMVCGVL